MKKLLLAAMAILPLCGCVTAEEMAANNARADDSECQSYGATPGSNAYFTCRMSKDQTRTYVSQIQAEAARQQINQGIRLMACSTGPC